MDVSTVIAAADAETRFSELLERTRRGEGFIITLEGKKVAKLIPSQERNPADIRKAIEKIRASRSVLNPPGLPRLQLRELIEEGRR